MAIRLLLLKATKAWRMSLSLESQRTFGRKWTEMSNQTSRFGLPSGSLLESPTWEVTCEPTAYKQPWGPLKSAVSSVSPHKKWEKEEIRRQLGHLKPSTET